MSAPTITREAARTQVDAEGISAAEVGRRLDAAVTTGDADAARYLATGKASMYDMVRAVAAAAEKDVLKVSAGVEKASFPTGVREHAFVHLVEQKAWPAATRLAEQGGLDCAMPCLQLGDLQDDDDEDEPLEITPLWAVYHAVEVNGIADARPAYDALQARGVNVAAALAECKAKHASGEW